MFVIKKCHLLILDILADLDSGSIKQLSELPVDGASYSISGAVGEDGIRFAKGLLKCGLLARMCEVAAEFKTGSARVVGNYALA